MKAINVGYLGKSILSKVLVIVTVFAIVFFYATVIKEFFGFLGAFDRRILFSQKQWWVELLCKNENIPVMNYKHSLSLKRFLVDVFPERIQFNNIYIFESDCNYKIPERFLCGAESVARYNPDTKVWFLTLSHYVDDQSGALRRLLKEIPNLKVVVADLDLLFKNTPFTIFNQTDKWTDIEEYKSYDVLDSIRLALIYRFGGTFLDADIISLKAVPEANNVMVNMDDGEMWNAFLKAASHNEAIESAIATMASQYNGSTWGAIGNKILGKAIRTHEKESKAYGTALDEFHILEYNKYQPILPDDSTTIFETNFNFTSLDSILNGSYGIHLSNVITKHLETKLGSSSLIESLAQKHCPTVYEEMEKNNYI